MLSVFALQGESAMYSPSLWASSHSNQPLGHHREGAELPVLHSSFPLAIYFTHSSVYMSVHPIETAVD